MPKRILSGTVVSASSNKTIVVNVTRRVKHKLYKKIISLFLNGKKNVWNILWVYLYIILVQKKFIVMSNITQLSLEKNTKNI